MVHKVVIIGSGPAGLTAGIYTARAKLNPLIIEGNLPGGQLMTTTLVENWPGEISTMGPSLMQKMRDHAKTYGATLKSDLVSAVDLSSRPYKIHLESNEILFTDSIIIASGAAHKKLGVKGEKEYWGKGVTTCATCDGPFYQGREVIIAGGGNTAVTEAAFLSRFVKKVTMIQILDQLSANDPIKDKVLADPKVSMIFNSKIIEIKGNNDHITSVIIEDQQTKEKREISADGIFVAIGFKPNTDMFKGKLDMDKWGYLNLTNSTQTSKEGIFAAGDVSDLRYMQAITAAGFGCMAALDCERYLTSLESTNKVS